MSKKDYIAFADMIRQARCRCKTQREFAVATGIMSRMANYFESQNPKFDREKWVRECHKPLIV